MSATPIQQPEVIQKETVSTLHFPSNDVIASNDDKKIRSSQLQRAILLGNNQKRKVKIVFEDDKNIKKVETTIWAVTEKSILLKGGVFIPIRRIHTISAY
jgi:hypothetical protein